MTPATILDPAVAAVDRTIEAVRYDRLDPAELSAVIAGLRELFWHTATLNNALTRAYDTASDIGHDNDGDPLASITTIVDSLHPAAICVPNVNSLAPGTEYHRGVHSFVA